MEIKSADVRLSNWVLKDGKPKQLKMCAFMDLHSFPSHFSGIELTEQVLLKCGFKYRSPGAGGQDEWAGMGYWSLGEFHLIGTKSGQVWFDRNRNWNIDFLHELQNIYSLLEKKELEFKA